jgi:NAD-dependent dihydropyrimidine dehydrogenase PreA subunit
VSDEAIYKELIEWLKKSWHLPETEELLPVVKARYTPAQAAFLTGMPFRLTKLEDLAESKGMDPAELGPELDALAKQGIVYRHLGGDAVLYRLNDAFFTFLRASFWRGGRDEATRALAPATNKYYSNGFFDDWADVHYKGLRALPIEETIADTKQIMPYEDVVKLVETLDYPSVSICPCKHRKNLDPDTPDCEHPDEVCLHFGDLSRYIVQNGLGRAITREETFEILRKAAKSGLVHGFSNWLEGADTLCNCCKCCCMFLEGYHVLHQSGSLSPSNYQVQSDHEKCKACGLCVKRCPMDAQRLEEWPEANNKFGKVSVPTLEHCIGCGVCVYPCPVEALTLVRCEEAEDPPKNVFEFAKHYAADRQAAQARGGKEKA